jgi:glyoxylase-like metal-dependent hydrolase (beta-lactamase superfamily II)
MFVNVSDHVYCRIGEKGDSNMGFIECEESVIVVDTAMYPAQTKEDIDEMRTITDKKIRFLINTHYHPDHTFGNMFFSDIIAHQACYTLLKEERSSYDEMRDKEEGFGDLVITLPNILFDEKMILHYTPEILLTHHGGHTEGSSTIFIPEEKILFSGDLIFAGYHPYIGDADVLRWIEILQELLTWDIESIVPGHGQVCGKKELKRHRDYLTIFYENLTELKEKYSKEELLKNPDLLDLPHLETARRIARNIEAQYDTL